MIILMNKLSNSISYAVLVSAFIEIVCFLYMICRIGSSPMIENIVIDLIFLITIMSLILTFVLVSFRIANKLDFKYYRFLLFVNCITWIVPVLFGIMFYQMREMVY